MIKNIRNFSNSWVAKVLLGLLALTFIFLWGMSGTIRMFITKDYVVKVGKESTDIYWFNKIYSINHKFFERMKIDDEKKQHMILQKTLDDIVEDSALTIFGKELGLSVTNQVLSNSIANDPRFLNKNNQYDPYLFQNMLKQQNLSDSDFRKIYSKIIRTNILKMPIKSIVLAPDFIARFFVRIMNEAMSISIIEINPDDFKITKTPNEIEFQKCYEKNIEKFFVPEYRTIEVLYFNESNVTTDVSEKDIKDEFRKRVASGEIDLETKFNDVKSDIKEEIENDKNYEYLSTATNDINNMAKSGTSLKEIANKYSFLKYKSVSLDQTNKDPKGNQALNTKFNDSIISIIFDSKKDNIPELIDCDNNNWAMVKVKSITASKTESIDEAKEKLTKILSHEQKIKEAKKYAKHLVEGINSFQKTAINTFNNSRQHKYLISRKNNRKLPKNMSARFFNKIFLLKKGKAIFDEVNGKILIARLNEKILPHENVYEEKIDDAKDSLREQFNNDIFKSTLSYIKEKSEVDINKSFLNFSRN